MMGQSTGMSPLVSMLFQTFLNPLKFLMEIFIILVCIYFLGVCVPVLAQINVCVHGASIQLN